MEEMPTSPRKGVSFNFDAAPNTKTSMDSDTDRTSSLKRQVTNRQLAQLLPFVPVMIHWLRDASGSSGGSLLFAAAADSVTASAAEDDLLRKFLDSLNFSADLTIHQIRELGNSATPQVWAAAIRRVVLDSDPHLIPGELGSELAKACSVAEESEDQHAHRAKSVLDGLSRTQYTALGELCALFRDTSEGTGEIATIVGLRLVNRHANTEESATQAQAVMQLLIANCEALFGRCAVSVVDGKSLGNVVGRLGAGSFSQTKSYLPKVSPIDALTSSRKHALKAFFQWNDEQYVGAVDLLFEHHSYRDIAWGVWDRYENLPGGWRGELEELKDSGDADYAWVPSSSQGNKPLFLASQKDDESNKSSRWLSRRTSNWNAPPTTPGFSTLNLVINEILDSEIVYYTMLKELQDNYVSVLRRIASGGGEAALALKISLADIESVFGWRLAQVIETSKTLMGHLAVVHLVRQEISGFPGGRSMMVANAFATIAPDLSSSYAPFISGHRHGMSVLGKASQNLRDGSSGGPGSLLKSRGLFGSMRFSKSKGGGAGGEATNILQEALLAARSASSSGQTSNGVHFMTLWEEIRETSKKLSGQSLQSVMITPIQRIPRYKMLLAELQKKLTQNHPALATLNIALEQISTVAQQVNQALRQHEKLENLIGKEEMPEISGTTMNLNKHQSFRLAVTYKAKRSEE
ncbi:hypothetical protein BASA82_000146 [Batrachochytrium salamandrivorans]|nr:hypothetical protein BASA82_000146 [Batrachochytrium salamandrivorans]